MYIHPAKKKAFEFYINSMIIGLPLQWREKTVENMLTQKQDAPTERLKEMLDICIAEVEELHQSREL